MTGKLDEALKALMAEALPSLFAGATPPVQLTIASDRFEVDPESADATASEPRPDNRLDNFPFDSDNPAGPYTLTQSPYPGPRRVRLITEIGDSVALRESEVIWDEVDSRRFTLALRPSRELTGIASVQVLYGVTAIFTKIKAVQTLTVQLQSSNAEQLEQAEALAVAVIELNRPHLVEAAQATFEDGDYGAVLEIKSLQLTKGTSPAANQRVLTLQAKIELKATRALREDEGRPIQRIRTPGRPLDPERKVDVHIEVEA